MKLTIILITVILFSTCLALGQDAKGADSNIEASKSVVEITTQIKSLKRKYDCISEYDRFTDEGYASCSIELVGFGEGFGKIFGGGLSGKMPADTPSFSLNFGFGFKTDRFDKNIEKFILIVHSSDTEWKLQKNSQFYAIADGERFAFGDGELIDTDYKVNTIPGARALEVGTRETVSFEITREQLRKLADAKLTEIRIGTREQKLKKKQQDIMKSILILATVSEKAAPEKKK